MSQKMKTTKTLPELDDTNYDDSEFVFSWNRDVPMIRPNLYKCPKCNHGIKRNCSNVGNCNNCGYQVSIYGYRDLVYDDTDNEINERPFVIDDGLISDDIERETLPGRRVKFANRTRVINFKKGSEPTDDETETGILETSETGKVVSRISSKALDPEDLVEGMDGSSSWGAGSCFSCVCMLLIVLCIAYKRDELKHKNGGVNLSLIICLVFLPWVYLSYASLDWLTSPGK